MKAFTGIKYIIIIKCRSARQTNSLENEKIFIYLSAEIEIELEKNGLVRRSSGVDRRES